MQKITPEMIKHIEAEYAEWGEFLNGVIGLLAFSFGLSCLGTDRPDITGFMSLVFILIFALYGKTKFPQKLKDLRKEELSGIDELILLGFERKYFSPMAVIKNFPVGLIGWFFLGGVTLYGAAENAGWL